MVISVADSSDLSINFNDEVDVKKLWMNVH